VKQTDEQTNNKDEEKQFIPFDDEDNTFFMQSPTALVVNDLSGTMISAAKPNLFKRSNVDLKKLNGIRLIRYYLQFTNVL